MPQPVQKSPACRIRNVLWIALALAVCALLAYCLWSDPPSFIATCGVLLVVPGALFGALLWLGRFLKRTGRRGGRLIAGIAWTGLALTAAEFAYVLWTAGPWFNGLIAHATSPDGREYAISQAWVDWCDDYDLRIFLRQPDGQWLSLSGGYFWSPKTRIVEVVLDGQDHLPEIRQADGSKRHFHRDFHAKDQPLHPANLTPADLHALHLDEMRANRSLFSIFKTAFPQP